MEKEGQIQLLQNLSLGKRLLKQDLNVLEAPGYLPGKSLLAPRHALPRVISVSYITAGALQTNKAFLNLGMEFKVVGLGI